MKDIFNVAQKHNESAISMWKSILSSNQTLRHGL